MQSFFVMTPTIRTHCFMWGGENHVLTLNHTMAPHWGVRALDIHRLDTPSGDHRCRGLLMQDTQPSDIRGTFYWTLTVGHTLGWPQPLGAPFTGHAAMGPHQLQHNASQATPGTALQIRLDARVAETCILLAHGPSVLARQNFTATRQLVCLVATTV
jgi:hypothetical protein